MVGNSFLNSDLSLEPGERNANRSSILAWRAPWTKKAWWTAVHGISKSRAQWILYTYIHAMHLKMTVTEDSERGGWYDLHEELMGRMANEGRWRTGLSLWWAQTINLMVPVWKHTFLGRKKKWKIWQQAFFFNL